MSTLSRYTLISVVVTCFLFIPFEALTQETVVNPDTTQQVSTKRNGFFDIFSGKPGKAALFSLLIPGGGQAYNKRYWKIPIAISIDAYTMYVARFYHNLYNQYDAAFNTMLVDPDFTFRGFTSASELKLYRDEYRRRMEYGYVYFGVAHLVTVIDAFVDRHLMNFDISEDLSFNLINDSLPLAYGTNPFLGGSFRISLNSSKKKLEDYTLINP